MTGLQLRAVVPSRGFDLEFSVPAGEVVACSGPIPHKSSALHSLFEQTTLASRR
jgi:hypothetical protein